MPTSRFVRSCRFRPSAALLVLSALTACSGNGLSAVESAFLAGSSSWDLNKDGVVTCDEWKGYIHSLFTEADVNRDGSLSREEFATFSKSDRMFDAADFAYWDANKDGRLTLAEMQAKPNPAFVLADRDKDCRLDASELVAARNITVVPITKPPDTKSGSPGR